jgi:diguanylate cyclase (GGDEF)-like protein
MRSANTALDLRTDSTSAPQRVRIEPRAPAEITPSELAGAVLQLSNRLQSSLEVESVLESLDDALRPWFGHQQLSYEHGRDRIRLQHGSAVDGPVSYEIVLLGEDLGVVSVGRPEPFDEQELARLEALLCALVYPLRNALLYRRALETAYKDPVTGVNNRMAFEQSLAREVELSQRHGTQLSLLMLDVDHFKQVNDRYGHVFGDSVLRAMAEVVLSCTRISDIVFRYGGEEFSLLLSRTDLAGAHCLGERICEAVRSTPFVHEGVSVHLSVSIGVAERRMSEPGTVLVQRADAALYRAKSGGRDRVIDD